MSIGLNKRGWIAVGFAVPAMALIALLAWASVESGSTPGGLGVNNDFGQVPVAQEAAREFSLELLNGTTSGATLDVADLRGKVVLLDFWASWCPPCRQEAPDLAQVYREFQGASVEFVGIDIWDGRQDALDHLSRYDVPYPNGIDSKGIIAIDYGVRGIPEKIFIDSNGVTIKKFVGPITADSLREILTQILATSGSGDN